MKAIVTRYVGATARRGSHIVAIAEGGARPHRVSIPYPHGLSRDDAHKAAALALCAKLGHQNGWNPSTLVNGSLPNGDEVFVFADELIRPLVASLRRLEKGVRLWMSEPVEEKDMTAARATLAPFSHLETQP